MAAYMRDRRARAGGWRNLERQLELKRLRAAAPVADFKPLPADQLLEGHCVFCGHRTVAVDDVCSMCRRDIEQ